MATFSKIMIHVTKAVINSNWFLESGNRFTVHQWPSLQVTRSQSNTVDCGGTGGSNFGCPAGKSTATGDAMIKNKISKEYIFSISSSVSLYFIWGANTLKWTMAWTKKTDRAYWVGLSPLPYKLWCFSIPMWMQNLPWFELITESIDLFWTSQATIADHHGKN